EAVQLEVVLEPGEVGVGEVHRGGRDGAARGGVDGEGAGVAEEVEEALAPRLPADADAGVAVVEEEPGVEVVAQVHQELQPRLLDDEALAAAAELLVLLPAPDLGR